MFAGDVGDTCESGTADHCSEVHWSKARLCLYNCSVHMRMTYYRMLLTSDPPCLCHAYHSRTLWYLCDHCAGFLLIFCCLTWFVQSLLCTLPLPSGTNSFNLEAPLSLAKFPFYWSFCLLGSIALFLFHSEIWQSGANYDEHGQLLPTYTKWRVTCESGWSAKPGFRLSQKQIILQSWHSLNQRSLLIVKMFEVFFNLYTPKFTNREKSSSVVYQCLVCTWKIHLQ